MIMENMTSILLTISIVTNVLLTIFLVAVIALDGKKITELKREIRKYKRMLLAHMHKQSEIEGVK